MAGSRLTKLDVIFNTVVEQIHILKNHTEIAHQAVQRIVFYINAAQFHGAFVHIPEPGHKAGKRCFAGTGGSHNSGSRAFWNCEAHIINDFPISIGEVHMLK